LHFELQFHFQDSAESLREEGHVSVRALSRLWSNS
jgi:hypothetical protein